MILQKWLCLHLIFFHCFVFKKNYPVVGSFKIKYIHIFALQDKEGDKLKK